MGQPIKIYVGNIPQSARSSELKELFEKFGKVVECDILKEFAFVHMEDTNDAKAAIAGLNDSLWKGSRIRVELSTTKTSKGEPSMRHRNYEGDLRGGLPPRRRSRERSDYRGRSPPYMGRDNGRDYNPRFGGAPSPYRSSDIRGAPMRDGYRYGGPPPGRSSRPYPEAYDRRGYPIEPNGRGPMGARGGAGYIPEYPFHPASYREPMRDHRGAPYSDPYGRGPPMGYGGPMSYYRGPPMPPPGRGYDYPPQGYPSSRPSRYSPPLGQYRGMSPRGGSSRDDGPTFNGHHLGSKSSSKRHHSNDSHSPSPRRNGHNKQQRSYSRSPSPPYRNGTSNNGLNKSRDTRSRSPQSPRNSIQNGLNSQRYGESGDSRSPSPTHHQSIKQKRHKSKDAASHKSKQHAASDGSSSNNSSINETAQPPRRKVTRHSRNKSSMSPVAKKKHRSKRVATMSSPSRSRSKSSNRSHVRA